MNEIVFVLKWVLWLLIQIGIALLNTVIVIGAIALVLAAVYLMWKLVVPKLIFEFKSGSVIGFLIMLIGTVMLFAFPPLLAFFVALIVLYPNTVQNMVEVTERHTKDKGWILWLLLCLFVTWPIKFLAWIGDKIQYLDGCYFERYLERAGHYLETKDPVFKRDGDGMFSETDAPVSDLSFAHHMEPENAAMFAEKSVPDLEFDVEPVESDAPIVILSERNATTAANEITRPQFSRRPTSLRRIDTPTFDAALETDAQSWRGQARSESAGVSTPAGNSPAAQDAPLNTATALPPEPTLPKWLTDTKQKAQQPKPAKKTEKAKTNRKSKPAKAAKKQRTQNKVKKAGKAAQKVRKPVTRKADKTKKAGAQKKKQKK